MTFSEQTSKKESEDIAYIYQQLGEIVKRFRGRRLTPAVLESFREACKSTYRAILPGTVVKSTQEPS